MLISGAFPLRAGRWQEAPAVPRRPRRLFNQAAGAAGRGARGARRARWPCGTGTASPRCRPPRSGDRAGAFPQNPPPPAPPVSGEPHPSPVPPPRVCWGGGHGPVTPSEMPPVPSKRVPSAASRCHGVESAGSHGMESAWGSRARPSPPEKRHHPPPSSAHRGLQRLRNFWVVLFPPPRFLFNPFIPPPPFLLLPNAKERC